MNVLGTVSVVLVADVVDSVLEVLVVAGEDDPAAVVVDRDNEMEVVLVARGLEVKVKELVVVGGAVDVVVVP